MVNYCDKRLRWNCKSKNYKKCIFKYANEKKSKKYRMKMDKNVDKKIDWVLIFYYFKFFFPLISDYYDILLYFR